jgi:hypothetical protein
MESEVKQTGMDEASTGMEIHSEATGNLATMSSGDQSQEQWQEVVEKVSEFLSDLPQYLSSFFGEYKRPIVTVGLIFAAIISVKLVLAVLSAINDLPLLAPLFELIGLGYSAWFVYRYLLKASDRQELVQDFNALKEQVLGQTMKD